MEDLRIFALTATTPHAAQTLFYVDPAYRTFPISLPTSRAASVETCHDAEAEEDSRSRPAVDLEFGFDRLPKDPKEGFVFGSDKNSCDIFLHLPKKRKEDKYISRRQFKIYPDAKGRLILKSYPNAPRMSISYNNQCGEELRKGFTWILFGEYNIEINMTPEFDNIDVRFKVELGRNWNALLHQYLQKLDICEPPILQGLVLESPTPTAGPSEISTPYTAPVYLRQSELGRGVSAIVYRAIDVSTGCEFALKVYDSEFEFQEIKRERDMLGLLSHRHIVKFVDFLTRPFGPSIVMNLMEHGNLKDQRIPFSEHEVIHIFWQGLEALHYLHTNQILHRDLKPQNVLLYSRSPLHICLSDFGLSKTKRSFTSFCGTPLYCAPEMLSGDAYTAAADVWSWALVVFELLYGIPKLESAAGRTPAERWPKWTKFFESLFKQLQGVEGVFAEYLTINLLTKDPAKRLTAKECLEDPSLLQMLPECNTPTEAATPHLDGFFEYLHTEYQPKTAHESAIQITNPLDPGVTNQSVPQNLAVDPKSFQQLLNARSKETSRAGEVQLVATTLEHPLRDGASMFGKKDASNRSPDQSLMIVDKTGQNKRKRPSQHAASPDHWSARREHRDLAGERPSPEIGLRSKKRGSLDNGKEPTQSPTSPHEHAEINPEFWSPWPSSGAIRKGQRAENHTEVEREEATLEVITLERPEPSTVLLRRGGDSIQANLTQILQIAGLSGFHQRLAFIAEHNINHEVDSSGGSAWVDLPTALKICGILVLPELIPHLVSQCRAPSQLDGQSTEPKELQQPQLHWKPGFKTITLKERDSPNRILLYTDYMNVRVNLTDILKSAGFGDFKHINSWIKMNKVNFETDKTSRRIRWIDISTTLRVCDKVLPELKPYLLLEDGSRANITVGEELDAQNDGTTTLPAPVNDYTTHITANGPSRSKGFQATSIGLDTVSNHQTHRVPPPKHKIPDVVGSPPANNREGQEEAFMPVEGHPTYRQLIFEDMTQPNTITFRDTDRRINITQIFRIAGFTNYNITTFVNKHAINFKSVAGGHNIHKGRWADLSASLKVCDLLLVNLDLDSADERQTRALKSLSTLIGRLIHEDPDHRGQS